MNNEVKKLYKEAIKNIDFDTEMIIKDPLGYRKPNFFSSEIVKIAYATAYYGWLLAKDEYKRENYY